MAYKNAPIHPVLKSIYAFLRFTARVGMGVFYRKRLILGSGYARFDGPAIVVSNHPSTLMDPLNVGIQIRQEMFFLANYSLFKHPLSNWILSRLFCIPIKRKEDVAEGEIRNNDAAFEASFQHLEKSGILYIAAEGVSWMNRFVRPFKTGTARIAFGTENRHDWQLGVKIIPVGLSYEAPNLFRSRMYVEYGPAIDPRPWAAAYQENPEKAVADFTTEIENTVRGLTLDSGAEDSDVWVGQVEALLRHSPPPSLHPSEQSRYFFLKDFLQKNVDNQSFKQKTGDYFESLNQAKITDLGLVSHAVGRPFPAFLGLLFPFFLLGYGFWFLPNIIPAWVTKRLQLYIGYDSNVKMLLGLFTYPLALWAAWKGVYATCHSTGFAWLALPILVVCGYLTERFLDRAKQWLEQQSARSFARQHPLEWENLLVQRRSIINIITAHSNDFNA